MPNAAEDNALVEEVSFVDAAVSGFKNRAAASAVDGNATGPSEGGGAGSVAMGVKREAAPAASATWFATRTELDTGLVDL